MFTITKQFNFSAGHILHGLREGHPCGRDHGHNYIIEVVLQSEHLNPFGFVEDYGDLADVKTFIDEEMDHRVLNEVFPNVQPSAENIARILYYKFKAAHPLLCAVRVSETPKTWAEYSQ